MSGNGDATAKHHQPHDVPGREFCKLCNRHEPVERPINDPLPKNVDTILTLVRTMAYNAALAHSYGPFTKAGAVIKAHQSEWSKTNRRTAWAFHRYLRTQLLAYLEDPQPFGALRTDATAWHEWVSNGVQSGQQTERLSKATQTVRDLLQHSRVASGKLVAPHVISSDRSVPRHLGVPMLKRQFGCLTWAAQRLQTLFLGYNADVHFVRRYADEAKRRGLEPVMLELEHYAVELAAFEPAKRDALEPRCLCGDERESHRRTTGRCATVGCACTQYEQAQSTAYEEGRTELGRYVRDGHASYDESQNGEEATEDDESGHGYETIEYHQVASDRDQVEPQYHHPLEDPITSATRETIASVGKQLHELQKTNGLHPKVAGYLWLLYRIQEERLMCPFMRWAINQVDQLTDPRALAKLGQQMHALRAKFISNERKLFWAKYHEAKARVTTQHSAFADLPHPSQIDFTLPDDAAERIAAASNFNDHSTPPQPVAAMGA